MQVRNVQLTPDLLDHQSNDGQAEARCRRRMSCPVVLNAKFKTGGFLAQGHPNATGPSVGKGMAQRITHRLIDQERQRWPQAARDQNRVEIKLDRHTVAARRFREVADNLPDDSRKLDLLAAVDPDRVAVRRTDGRDAGQKRRHRRARRHIGAVSPLQQDQRGDQLQGVSGAMFGFACARRFGTLSIRTDHFRPRRLRHAA